MRRAYVYVDGQNLRGSARDFFGRQEMDAKLPHVLQSLMRANGMLCAGVRYYTGILPAEHSKKHLRAREIARLDHLQGQEITTFCNDLIRNEVGRFRETGIDQKIAADIFTDVYNKRADAVVILTNDRDLEPVVQAINDLSRASSIDVKTYNVVCGSARGLSNAQHIKLTSELFNAHIEDLSWLDREAEERMQRDPEGALNASAHAGERQERTNISHTPEARRGTAYFFDLDSIGLTAKKSFARNYMDADVRRLTKVIATKTAAPPTAGASVYMSVHSAERDLVNHEMANDIGRFLSSCTFDVHRFPYEYLATTVGSFDSGVSAATPLRTFVPMPKRIKTELLCDVAKKLAQGKCDDVVLVSDDPDLWPICDIADAIGRSMGKQIGVRNAHFGQTVVDGMADVALSRDDYEQSVEEVNRMERAKTAAGKRLQSDLEALRSKVGDVTSEANVMPDYVEGRIHGMSAHFLAVQTDDGFAYLERNTYEGRYDTNKWYAFSRGGVTEIDRPRQHTPEQQHSR